jgi:hypothetical protein
MLKRYFLFVVAAAVLLPLAGAYAATSIPMPEAGFAVASNNGGADTIATPMSSDLGGGTTRIDRDVEIAVDTPNGNAAPVTADKTVLRDGRAVKNIPTDGTAPANSTTTSHKSRGNAHWQSLLPGLMN